MIADRLLSLVITDEDGFQSDTGRFTLDNRDQKIGVPSNGVSLDIRLGYEGGASWLTGQYIVDEIELSGNPEIMVIGAKAANMRNRLKAPKSRSWHEKTIGEIVATIAGEHQYKSAVAASITATAIPHIDQTEESDMHLLTRLAELLGCVFKPANGYLIFAPRQELKSVTGKTLPAVRVNAQDLTGKYRYRSVERGKYQSVVARWRDTAANMDVEETVGSGGPVYILRNSFATATEARAAAKAKKEALDRGTATLTIPMIGTPEARAERPLLPSGFNPVVDGASWVISRASHTFNNSGFTSSIEAEIKK
mgnify:FL=1|tara:strand:- start:38878 stop:39804 length:927 start_codon:yes stop_codon:yes gene_type:complete